MTTAIDTNVVIALWDPDAALSLAAQTALEKAFRRGGLVVAAPVFSELIAASGRTESFVDAFLDETGVSVDWALREAAWRSAGRAFQSYERRRKQRDSGARRILADFLIGAHALVGGHRLLTLDKGLYVAAFPGLRVETV